LKGYNFGNFFFIFDEVVSAEVVSADGGLALVLVMGVSFLPAVTWAAVAAGAGVTA
jgi:hypothetical protein